MKYIRKTTAPADFLLWCFEQKKLGLNYKYTYLPRDEKASLQKQLVIEQRGLCGYTMKKISILTSHVEHIKPQNECLKDKDEKDLDYHNVLACFPKIGKSKCLFGAEKKGGWWDAGLFVSPLLDSCELKFIYTLEGKVIPCGANISASTKTIQVLNLTEKTLTEERKKAIEDFIFGNPSDPHSGPLSFAEAHKAIDEIHLPDPTGQLYEFCIAIHDALYEYLDILKKITSPAHTSIP